MRDKRPAEKDKGVKARHEKVWRNQQHGTSQSYTELLTEEKKKDRHQEEEEENSTGTSGQTDRERQMIWTEHRRTDGSRGKQTGQDRAREKIERTK